MSEITTRISLEFYLKQIRNESKNLLLHNDEPTSSEALIRVALLKVWIDSYLELAQKEYPNIRDEILRSKENEVSNG